MRIWKIVALVGLGAIATACGGDDLTEYECECAIICDGESTAADETTLLCHDLSLDDTVDAFSDGCLEGAEEVLAGVCAELSCECECENVGSC